MENCECIGSGGKSIRPSTRDGHRGEKVATESQDDISRLTTLPSTKRFPAHVLARRTSVVHV